MGERDENVESNFSLSMYINTNVTNSYFLLLDGVRFTTVLPVYCSAGKIQSRPDPLLHVDTPQHSYAAQTWIVSMLEHCRPTNRLVVAFSRQTSSTASHLVHLECSV